MNKFLSCLIFLGGMLIAAFLYLQLGWNEGFDAEYKTPFLVAIGT
jgi:hypothetical protein